jgi:hypothetical protein
MNTTDFDSHTAQVRCDCGKTFWKLSRRDCPDCGAELSPLNCRPFDPNTGVSEFAGTTSRPTRWFLYAEELAPYIVDDLARAGIVKQRELTEARLKFKSSVARELESLYRTMENSSRPERDFVAFLTGLAVRRTFNTDKFINAFAELCQSSNSDENLVETIRKRVETKIAAEEEIVRCVNLVFDAVSDWCSNAAEPIKKFFEEIAKSDREITHQEIEDWNQRYNRELELQRQRPSQAQRASSVEDSNNTRTVPSNDENNSYAFGCLIAIPFALVGFIIHPFAGLAIGFIVTGIVGAIAQKVGIWNTIVGGAVICYFLYKIFVGK